MLGDKKSVNLINTGSYSEKAKNEILKHTQVKEVNSNTQAEKRTLGEDW